MKTRPQRRKRPAILFLTDTASRLAGAERSLLSLLESLPADAYRPIVWTFEEGPLATIAREAHAEVVVKRLGIIQRTRNPLKLLLYGAFFLHGVVSLAWVIWRRGVSIVHINKNTLALPGIPAARLAGAKALWHVRNPVRRFGRLGAWLVRRCHAIALVSEWVAAPFREAFPDASATMHIVPEGIDPARFDERPAGRALREALGLGEDQLLIGTVGRITRWKGQDVFLRAAARLAASFPQARFAIVGDCVSSPAERQADEAFKAELLSLAKELGLDQKVFFLGHREDIPAVMNALDVFVLPSRQEPFGLVVLEAMAAGCPIVATNAGGVPEIVRHEGEALLVPADDPDAMAAAIERLLADKALGERLGRAAAERARTEFPLWRFGARFREIYAGLGEKQA